MDVRIAGTARPAFNDAVFVCCLSSAHLELFVLGKLLLTALASSARNS